MKQRIECCVLRVSCPMLQKITDNLFYLFIFLLPWQTVFILREPIINGEKWQYGTIGIYLTDVILLAWLALMLYKNQNAKCKNQNDKLKFLPEADQPLADKIQEPKFLVTNYWLLITGCLILWLFASILWSADSMLAFYFSLKLLLAVGLFLALQKIRINWRKIVFVFLAAAVLQSALAVGQFAFQGSFSSKWLGTNNYEAWRGGVSVLENEGGRWLRAYGSLPHPNVLGGYLALAFIAGLYFLLSNYRDGINYENAKITKKRANFQFPIPNFQSIFNDIISNAKNNKTKLNQIAILASLLIIFMGILLTFSRGAWLALAVGIVFLGVSIGLKKNFVKLLLILGLAGIIFIGINHENFSTRFDAGKRLEQKSISERSLYFNQAKEIIGENFWLGTGAGNYTLAVFQKDETKNPIWQYQPVHNVLALIWAELGIVGLILFILFLTQVFLKSLKNKTPFYCLLFIVYCLLFIDHWLWTTHFGMLFFWLVAGLAVKSRNIKRIT